MRSGQKMTTVCQRMENLLHQRWVFHICADIGVPIVQIVRACVGGCVHACVRAIIPALCATFTCAGS